MQNSHQEWKTHHLSQGNSFCKEKRNSHFQTWKMRKTWIHVHLHQGTLLQTDTLCSAHSHTQGEFHRTSNNWKNVHDKGTLSNNLKIDTNMDANIDTNHTAHRYRHTEKEVHLLSEPSELRPLKAMAHWYTEKEAHLLSESSELRPLKAVIHRHTGKEAHLLSGPSELQSSEDSRTQKFRSSTQVQQPRQEYSQFTETEKAKFQDPFTYNDERNFVRHNSVDKFSPNLVYMTTPNTSSVSNSVFFRKKGRKCRDSRNCGGCTCNRRTCTCTCTCTCTHTGDSPRVTTHSRNKKVNKELWETSQCI